MFKPYDIERAAGRHSSAQTEDVAPRAKLVIRNGVVIDLVEEAKQARMVAEAKLAKPTVKKPAAKPKPVPVVEKVEVVASPLVVEIPEADDPTELRAAKLMLLGVLTARRGQLERAEETARQADEATMLQTARQKLVARIERMDPGIFQGDDLTNWMVHIKTAEMIDIEQANHQFDVFDADCLEQKAKRDREERSVRPTCGRSGRMRRMPRPSAKPRSAPKRTSASGRPNRSVA